MCRHPALQQHAPPALDGMHGDVPRAVLEAAAACQRADAGAEAVPASSSQACSGLHACSAAAAGNSITAEAAHQQGRGGTGCFCTATASSALGMWHRLPSRSGQAATAACKLHAGQRDTSACALLPWPCPDAAGCHGQALLVCCTAVHWPLRCAVLDGGFSCGAVVPCVQCSAHSGPGLCCLLACLWRDRGPESDPMLHCSRASRSLSAEALGMARPRN